VDTSVDKVPFYPYFIVKDIFAFFIFTLVFSIFVFYFPNAMGHPDNYIPANPLVTPAHIVPEWYFLPFYAILRSIPDKLGGVLAMFGSILVLAIIPFIIPKLNIRSTLFRPIARKLFWVQLVNCLILGWIGQNVVEYPYIEIGQIATAFYFLYFLVLLPGLVVLENKLLSTKV
jgi:quinol-cytochrome oxidoreductase complex cytochrome b subunit